jgi:hypothetical protein
MFPVVFCSISVVFTVCRLCVLCVALWLYDWRWPIWTEMYKGSKINDLIYVTLDGTLVKITQDSSSLYLCSRYWVVLKYVLDRQCHIICRWPVWLDLEIEIFGCARLETMRIRASARMPMVLASVMALCGALRRSGVHSEPSRGLSAWSEWRLFHLIPQVSTNTNGLCRREDTAPHRCAPEPRILRCQTRGGIKKRSCNWTFEARSGFRLDVLLT